MRGFTQPTAVLHHKLLLNDSQHSLWVYACRRKTERKLKNAPMGCSEKLEDLLRGPNQIAEADCFVPHPTEISTLPLHRLITSPTLNLVSLTGDSFLLSCPLTSWSDANQMFLSHLDGRKTQIADCLRGKIPHWP